jgi:hypothetical protein
MGSRSVLLNGLSLAVVAVSVMAGCAEVLPNGTEPFPAARAIVGKSKEALLACAGAPIKQQVKREHVLFVYFKEASQLEESFSGSKSSFAKVHHGCRATILLEADHVTGVQYDSEPSSYQDDDHCDEIFLPCLGP